MGWLYVYAQQTDVKVLQRPATGLKRAEENSEALVGSSRWADPRDQLHPGTQRASPAPSLPNTANAGLLLYSGPACCSWTASLEHTGTAVAWG